MLMHEYGASLREIDTYWTTGRTLLYLRRIGERYDRQRKARKGAGKEKTYSETELLNSDFLKG